MLELLAPAGSMEALRAAVQNGADAVYLGVDNFNARMSAKNFSLDSLREAAVYCRVRGVKLHLTLNTLVCDRQLHEAAALIRGAAHCGVDAFIVQDLGVLRLCREIAPDIPCHASTQMSLHSLEGVRAAAALGCTRAVLARELPAGEIRNICAESPIEIEVFGHGALCMSYSGQCYFSAVVGRRSGNRGQCAQPCRQPYGYSRFEARYPLSLKDNCLLSHLRALDEMGVASLKLEGRMKRPEYVAVTTRIYRAALDGREIRPEDYRELERVFSRQGFTDGYLRGRAGGAMLGVHLDGREDKALFAAARATYENHETPRVPVRFRLTLQPGRAAELRVGDREGRVAVSVGQTPETARNNPLTPELAEARLRRTGGTPYRCEGVESDVAPGLSLSVSALNTMRRAALSRLTALRGRREEPALHPYRPIRAVRGPNTPPALTVQVRSWEQVTDRLLRTLPAVLYLPLTEIAAQPDRVYTVPRQTAVAAVLPRVVWGREQEKLARALDTAQNAGVREALIGNLGQLELTVPRGLSARGDFGLNVFNSAAAGELRRLGFASLTASFELLLAQIRALSKPLPTELIAYGRLPLMLTENCVIRNRTGACACEGALTRLVDRTGAEFPVVNDPGTCRSVILNGKKLYLLDQRDKLRDLGLWALRLCFTTESARETDQVLEAWRHGGGFAPSQHTRGLYYRGVG